MTNVIKVIHRKEFQIECTLDTLFCKGGRQVGERLWNKETIIINEEMDVNVLVLVEIYRTVSVHKIP